MRLPGRVWIAIHRTQNRWRDMRARLAGYCNDRPVKLGIPGESSGYRHWRCALRRGHDGLHRARNYVWSVDGRTEYLPIPIGKPMPQQPWERTNTPTMRQARNARRWHAEQTAKRRAARNEEPE